MIRRTSAGGRLRYQGMYRDPSGRQRSAGSYSTERQALRAAGKAEAAIDAGTWFDVSAGKVTFRAYAREVWWPSLHLEPTTKAAYRSNLETHFLPFFGDMRMANILPSHVQVWVNKALEGGLTPRSVVKYHVVLHGIFRQAVRDRVIPFNPAAETKLPKVVRKQRRILTPKEFQTLLEQIPHRWLPLVLTSIETGLRWGELVALRPRHIDWPGWHIHVEQVALELSKRNSPTGQRIVFRDYPKDDEPRTLAVSHELIAVLKRRVEDYGLGPDHLLFPSTEGPSLIPVSRNTFRTKVWLPAVEEAKLGFPVRMHDLRHAHASWLLAGGADLAAVMERLGHRQIMTTQQYLHTLPDADRKALEAFSAIRHRKRRRRLPPSSRAFLVSLTRRADTRTRASPSGARGEVALAGGALPCPSGLPNFAIPKARPLRWRARRAGRAGAGGR